MSAPNVLEMLKAFRWLAARRFKVTIRHGAGEAFALDAILEEGVSFPLSVSTSDRYLQVAAVQLRVKAEVALSKLGLAPAPPSIDDHLDALDEKSGPAASEAKEFLDRLEGMIESGDYDRVVETLEGIHKTVQASGKVTGRQREAIENIERAGEGKRGR